MSAGSRVRSPEYPWAVIRQRVRLRRSLLYGGALVVLVTGAFLFGSCGRGDGSEGGAPRPEMRGPEPSAAVVVRAARPDGTPLLGARVAVERLGDPSYPAPPMAETDSSGRASFGDLEEGRYRVAIEGDGLFPGEAEVEAVSGKTTAVAVTGRYRGDLQVAVVSMSGASTEGARVTVLDLLTGTDVARWIERGLVETGPSGLVADAEGRVHLTGLPEGTYRLLVAGGAQGTAAIPPGGLDEIELYLP